MANNGANAYGTADAKLMLTISSAFFFSLPKLERPEPGRSKPEFSHVCTSLCLSCLTHTEWLLLVWVSWCTLAHVAGCSVCSRPVYKLGMRKGLAENKQTLCITVQIRQYSTSLPCPIKSSLMLQKKKKKS